jgi:opacity protein-like surface antigen
MCCASFQTGIYVGAGLGWSRLSTQRTLGWDRDVYTDIWFANHTNQRGSGLDDIVFAGWMMHCRQWVWGVELDFGYGFAKIAFEQSNPYKKTDVFVSDLSVGPRGGLSVMGGYGVAGWTGLLQLGYTCMRLTHAYEDREGSLVEDFRTVRAVSSGFAIGGVIQKKITGALSVRVGYTYAFYSSIEHNFRNSWNNTTIVQKAASPNSQKIMMSIVWHPWRSKKCRDTLF